VLKGAILLHGGREFSMERRHLIRLASLSLISGGALLSTGIYQWWNIPPDKPYKLLSSKEGLMILAISGAMFPKGEEISWSGDELQLDRFFDQLLLELGETEQQLIKFFLHFIDKSAYLSENQSAFLDMDIHKRQVFLESWLQHSNHLLRNALLSIVTLLGMGYTSHPLVSPRLAMYHRCGFG